MIRRIPRDFPTYSMFQMTMNVNSHRELVNTDADQLDYSDLDNMSHCHDEHDHSTLR